MARVGGWSRRRRAYQGLDHGRALRSVCWDEGAGVEFGSTIGEGGTVDSRDTVQGATVTGGVETKPNESPVNEDAPIFVDRFKNPRSLHDIRTSLLHQSPRPYFAPAPDG
jgi:hypothetical protein